jgi:hypothetical protein
MKENVNKKKSNFSIAFVTAAKEMLHITRADCTKVTKGEIHEKTEFQDGDISNVITLKYFCNLRTNFRVEVSYELK